MALIEVKLDQGDLQKVINRYSRYDNNVRQGVQREVGHSALSIQSRARRLLRLHGAIATNRLRSSINIRYTTDRLGAVIGTNVNYAGDVEEGQKPGRWPNVGDLMRWVQKKIVRSPMKEVRRITFLVGRKIYLKGTEAKPYMRPAGEKEWPNFVRNIKRVLKTS